MNLHAQLSRGFAQAQSLIAQAQGMPSGGTNVLYNGAAYIGVFGAPAPEELMNPGGGHRPRTQLSLTMTRSQFAQAPTSQTELNRTDLSPPITYRIAKVDMHDPIHYVLTLVKVG